MMNERALNSTRVLLVHPPLSGRDRYGKYEEVGSYLPPYGLCTIAAVLERAGCQVQIIDGLCEKLDVDEVVRRALDFEPHVIGITLYTIALEQSLLTARSLKAALDVPIVVGGPHLTLHADECLTEECFDVGVIGEGEETMLELVAALQAGKPLDDIAGLVYRANGTVIRTAPRPYLQDLDQLPFPAYHLLPDLDLYYPTAMVYKRRPILTLITSRGCPYSCIFCSPFWGRRWRANSALYVVDLMEHLVGDFGVRELIIYEDIFTIRKDRVLEICQSIQDRKLRVLWTCSAHVNTLDREVLAAMKAAGCWLISLGIESGDEEVLKFIKKNISLKRARQVVGWADELGLAVRGFFILGHPTDTAETIEKTIRLATELPLHTVNFTLLYPNPGSELYTLAPQYGHVDYDVKLQTGHPPSGLSFVPHGLTESFLKKKQREAYRRFYLRPSQLWRMVKHLDGWEDFVKYCKMAKTFVKVSLG
jgi:radical SAM superfamily enzyme YgiQ (UPF0313 family)